MNTIMEIWKNDNDNILKKETKILFKMRKNNKKNN